MKSLASFGNYLKVDTCNQWYMYDFDKNLPADDREFFGYNDGGPWPSQNSSGMLDGKANILSYTCNEINKTVPYFKEFRTEDYPTDELMSDYLGDVIKTFSSVALDFSDREAKFPELDLLPDGAFIIK